MKSEASSVRQDDGGRLDPLLWALSDPLGCLFTGLSPGGFR